jgi:predicted ATPase
VFLSFRVENHRSIRDEQAFSMESGRFADGDDPVRDEDGERVLSVAAIYGPNASGKSNLLGGLAFMRSAVLHSHRFYSPEGGVPRTAFAWGAKASEPSLFEISFKLSGVRYEYGFVADSDRFLEEWLHAYPSSRKQVWFERDEDDLKFGEHLKGENRLAEKVTRPNSLFLSAAAQNRHEQLMPIYSWFSSIKITGEGSHSAWGGSVLRSPPRGAQLGEWMSLLLEEVSVPGPEMSGAEAGRFRNLLRAADFGILDWRVIKEQGPAGQSKIMVRHKSEQEEAWLPLEEESHGTKQLFSLAPALLEALAQGSPVLIDELEASLHPLLALQLVKTFNDRNQNPRNAQLVFTTHDTNLLGTTYETPPLRRAQVWLTEKDDSGATRVYPLTDYKPRKAENLERGYLQGRYGAIPFLEPLVSAEPGDQ